MKNLKLIINRLRFHDLLPSKFDYHYILSWKINRSYHTQNIPYLQQQQNKTKNYKNDHGYHKKKKEEEIAEETNNSIIKKKKKRMNSSLKR